MQKVDENTLFGIASNSKAFTAAALGMLVDEKKIGWDDKVQDYIPDSNYTVHTLVQNLRSGT
jgi:CubicO group peptidase (beta-lactamase class C family)